MKINAPHIIRKIALGGVFSIACGCFAADGQQVFWVDEALKKSELDGDGVAVSQMFEFKNNGKTPISVKSVYPLCDCVKADWAKNKIPPGGGGAVKLSYTASKPGEGRGTGAQVTFDNDETYEIHWMISGGKKPPKSTVGLESSSRIPSGEGIKLDDLPPATFKKTNTKSPSDSVFVWGPGEDRDIKVSLSLPQIPSEGYAVHGCEGAELKIRPKTLEEGGYDLTFIRKNMSKFWGAIVVTDKTGNPAKVFYVRGR